MPKSTKRVHRLGDRLDFHPAHETTEAEQSRPEVASAAEEIVVRAHKLYKPRVRQSARANLDSVKGSFVHKVFNID